MTTYRDALVRARAALASLADVAVAVSEAYAADQARERERAKLVGEPPDFNPEPNDLRVEVSFSTWCGDEVGYVTFDELTYHDLWLKDFKRAREALALINTVLATPAAGIEYISSADTQRMVEQRRRDAEENGEGEGWWSEPTEQERAAMPAEGDDAARYDREVAALNKVTDRDIANAAPVPAEPAPASDDLANRLTEHAKPYLGFDPASPVMTPRTLLNEAAARIRALEAALLAERQASEQQGQEERNAIVTFGKDYSEGFGDSQVKRLFLRFINDIERGEHREPAIRSPGQEEGR